MKTNANGERALTDDLYYVSAADLTDTETWLKSPIGSRLKSLQSIAIKPSQARLSIENCRLTLAVIMVAPQGFEPRYAAPEAAVLPLNEGAMRKTGSRQVCQASLL
jgi:hypothetical protein